MCLTDPAAVQKVAQGNPGPEDPQPFATGVPGVRDMFVQRGRFTSYRLPSTAFADGASDDVMDSLEYEQVMSDDILVPPILLGGMTAATLVEAWFATMALCGLDLQKASRQVWFRLAFCCSGLVFCKLFGDGLCSRNFAGEGGSRTGLLYYAQFKLNLCATHQKKVVSILPVYSA